MAEKSNSGYYDFLMRKLITLAVTIFLVGSMLTPQAFASVKQGSKCTIQGQTKNWQGKKFTCIKSGKKLIWGKGIPVAKPVTSPTPAPTPTPTPTPTTASSVLSSPSSYLSVNECQLKNGSGQLGVNQSFQQNPYRV